MHLPGCVDRQAPHVAKFSRSEKSCTRIDSSGHFLADIEEGDGHRFEERGRSNYGTSSPPAGPMARSTATCSPRSPPRETKPSSPSCWPDTDRWSSGSVGGCSEIVTDAEDAFQAVFLPWRPAAGLTDARSISGCCTNGRSGGDEGLTREARRQARERKAAFMPDRTAQSARRCGLGRHVALALPVESEAR